MACATCVIKAYFLIARRAIQADGTDRQYLGVLAVTSNSAVNAPIENYHCDTFHLRAQDTQARISLP